MGPPGGGRVARATAVGREAGLLPRYEVSRSGRRAGVPVGTVKSRLHSAVKRLGKAWEDTQPADPGLIWPFFDCERSAFARQTTGAAATYNYR